MIFQKVLKTGEMLIVKMLNCPPTPTPPKKGGGIPPGNITFNISLVLSTCLVSIASNNAFFGDMQISM